jgi:pimeloyl-ACP methyl ester carboxylesterase
MSFSELYPFESNYLTIDGHQYHYLDEGTGPVVLMLHGNPTWSFYYRDLVCGLRNNYRVIVPDHIGCGLSDKPRDYPYQLQSHIDNLEILLEHLDIESVNIAVHDWGGPIGFGYAVKHPDRIKKITIFNTTTFLTSKYPLGILLCKVPVLGSIAVRGFNLFARCAVWFASCNPERMTADVKAGYLKPYDNYRNRIATLAFVQDIPLNKRHRSWTAGKLVEDNIGTLAEKPVMICWGKRDFCFNDHFLERIRASFPAAEVHEFPEAGHYVVEDAGAEILPMLRDFLQD